MNWINREYWASRSRLPRAFTRVTTHDWRTLFSPSDSTPQEQLEVFNKMQRKPRNGETQ
jgi:hypothetical protein